jgi:hypothetical protein
VLVAWHLDADGSLAEDVLAGLRRNDLSETWLSFYLFMEYTYNWDDAATGTLAARSADRLEASRARRNGRG